MSPEATRREEPAFGYLAEFGDIDHLVQAVERVRADGFRRFDAHAPFPHEPLHEAMGPPSPILGRAMLAGALAGGLGAYVLQYWTAVLDYPWRIGGKPLHSWPMFVPVTFELTILGAALTGFVTMMFLTRLPRLHHPVFESERFRRASEYSCFLSIEKDDDAAGARDVAAYLRELGAVEVTHV